jgi:hypothetical protein
MVLTVNEYNCGATPEQSAFSQALYCSLSA